METKFRTSFIPKKALSLKREAPVAPAVHIFLAVGTVIFFLALAGSAGLYFYEVLIEKSIEEKSLALQKAKQAFETSFIADAKRLDKRISSAKTILDSHIIVTPIFDFLEIYTLQTVRFASFDYQYREGVPTLEMEGEAQSYASIALQSDSFVESTDMISPVFADPDLNPKGGVLFSFSGEFSSDIISYGKNFAKMQEEFGAFPQRLPGDSGFEQPRFAEPFAEPDFGEPF